MRSGGGWVGWGVGGGACGGGGGVGGCWWGGWGWGGGGGGGEGGGGGGWGGVGAGGGVISGLESGSHKVPTTDRRHQNEVRFPHQHRRRLIVSEKKKILMGKRIGIRFTTKEKAFGDSTNIRARSRFCGGWSNGTKKPITQRENNPMRADQSHRSRTSTNGSPLCPDDSSLIDAARRYCGVDRQKGRAKGRVKLTRTRFCRGRKSRIPGLILAREYLQRNREERAAPNTMTEYRSSILTASRQSAQPLISEKAAFDSGKGSSLLWMRKP